MTAAWTAFALALPGCGGEDVASGDGPPAPAVRDSAGVRVVEYQGALPRDAVFQWRVGADPRTVVGRDAERPGHALVEVVGLTVLGDGTLVVADGETLEVHLYGPDGRLRTTVGGEGQGPGEYSAILGLQRLDGAPDDPGDDRFVVLDVYRSSGDVYDAEGTRLGEVAVPRPETLAQQARYLEVLGLVGADTVVLRGETSFMETSFEDGANRAVLDVGLATATDDGAFRVKVLDSFPGNQVNIERTASGGVRYTGYAFAAFGRLDVARRVWAAATDRWVVTGIDPRAGSRLSIRVDEPRRPVTDEDVEAFWEVFLGDRELTDDQMRLFRRQTEDAPRPESWPVLEDVHGDRSGGVWVEDYRLRREEAAVLDRFDGEGRWEGWVELPPGYGPRRTVRDPGLFFDGEVVAGVWVNELDVQEVRVYELERPEGPEG